jgi:hypothetical protein
LKIGRSLSETGAVNPMHAPARRGGGARTEEKFNGE